MFLKDALIVDTSVYINSNLFSKEPKMSAIFLGYLYKQISCQELSKVTQSGHTDPNSYPSDCYWVANTHGRFP